MFIKKDNTKVSETKFKYSIVTISDTLILRLWIDLYETLKHITFKVKGWFTLHLKCTGAAAKFFKLKFWKNVCSICNPPPSPPPSFPHTHNKYNAYFS